MIEFRANACYDLLLGSRHDHVIRDADQTIVARSARISREVRRMCPWAMAISISGSIRSSSASLSEKMWNGKLIRSVDHLALNFLKDIHPQPLDARGEAWS